MKAVWTGQILPESGLFTITRTGYPDDYIVGYKGAIKLIDTDEATEWLGWMAPGQTRKIIVQCDIGQWLIGKWFNE